MSSGWIAFTILYTTMGCINVWHDRKGLDFLCRVDDKAIACCCLFIEFFGWPVYAWMALKKYWTFKQ